MLCSCGSKTEVIDSRFCPGGKRRRRKCVECNQRFTTLERKYYPNHDSIETVSNRIRYHANRQILIADAMDANGMDPEID